MRRSAHRVRFMMIGLTLAALPVLPAVGNAAQDESALPTAKSCDATDSSQCLLPFPNDRFTKSDADTPTGKRIDFSLGEMPSNTVGKPIDPSEWNRNDGFSPGSMVLADVPGLDLGETFGLDEHGVDDVIEDPEMTLDSDSPMVILDAGPAGDEDSEQKPEQHPFWAELDSDDEQTLELRPTVNFDEGHRYIVALRNPRDADGDAIEADDEFEKLRDHEGSAEEGSRQEHFDQDIFPVLERAGIDRDDMFLSWDFTVASGENLTDRARQIRDDAFAELGGTDLSDDEIAGDSPEVEVTDVDDYTRDEKKNTQREIHGKVTVPNYLIIPDSLTTPEIEDPTDLLTDIPPQALPGSRFNYDEADPGPMATPQQNPVSPDRHVEFVCSVPRNSSAKNPATPMLYGHGLLGSRSESTGGSTERMREKGYMPCAVDWIGMSNRDILNVVTILTDVSNFRSMADRGQQSFLDFQFLGRALRHDDGLVAQEGFQTEDGKPLIDNDELVYDGNSQGGIMGGGLTALAPDLTRSVLGVTGMNYSTLLNRSVDWEGQYSEVFEAAYTQPQEQQLTYGLMQMLWDRAEANGYAQHMTTDPLPDTPEHQVLMHTAFGDYQVPNVAAEVEARTVGAPLLGNSVPDRHWAKDPSFGFDVFGKSASSAPEQNKGSALVYWDAGNPVAPNDNRPPEDKDEDPHGVPRRDPYAAKQKDVFYHTGVIEDVHDGGPYVTTDPVEEEGRASIKGDAIVGETLEGDPASFTGEPDNESQQWLADGKPISDKTGTSLKLTPDMEGKKITFQSTGKKKGLDGVKSTSEAVGPVEADEDDDGSSGDGSSSNGASGNSGGNAGGDHNSGDTANKKSDDDGSTKPAANGSGNGPSTESGLPAAGGPGVTIPLAGLLTLLFGAAFLKRSQRYCS